MNSDSVIGLMLGLRGTVLQMAGRTLGDSRLETEGRAVKAVGSLRKTLGRTKHVLRSAVRA